MTALESTLRNALREVRARKARHVRLPATVQLPRELAARAKPIEKDRVALPVDVLEAWLHNLSEVA